MENETQPDDLEDTKGGTSFALNDVILDAMLEISRMMLRAEMREFVVDGKVLGKK